MKPIHLFIMSLFVAILYIPAFLWTGTCEAASTTVAVLPFENLNRDSTYGLLSRGMCESLITGLSSVQSLILVERAQVEKTLKEQALGLTGVIDDKTAPKVGQLLGAKYVVMGSYQVMGKKVRINTRFVDVETGQIDQSKVVSVTGKYPDEVFALQDQIASKLVASFNVATSKAETDQMADVLKSTQNFTAYELYIKGRNAWLLGTETGYKEAIAYCRKAIELDPNYALAYNYLGNALGDQGNYEESIEAYRKAIEIKPDFALAYSNLGVTFEQQGKYEEAIAAYRKTIEIEPELALAYSNLGNTLRRQGKYEEGIEALRKAIELKPDFANAYCNLGIALRQQGKTDEAIAAFCKAIELKPDFALALENLASLLDDKDVRIEARGYWERAFKLEKKPEMLLWIMKRLAEP